MEGTANAINEVSEPIPKLRALVGRIAFLSNSKLQLAGKCLTPSLTRRSRIKGFGTSPLLPTP